MMSKGVLLPKVKRVMCGSGPALVAERLGGQGSVGHQPDSKMLEECQEVRKVPVSRVQGSTRLTVHHFYFRCFKALLRRSGSP